MAIELEMVGSILAGAIGGAIGVWRSGTKGTQTSLDRGNQAFSELRAENRELRDRLARLEGALQMAVGLGALEPKSSERQGGDG